MNRIIPAALLFLFLSGAVFSQSYKGVSPEDAKALGDVIAAYNNGLSSNSAQLTLSSIGPEFTIFNGNFSGDPTQWQAHLFRAGEGLKTYVTNFIKNAGPHENKYQTVHIYVRGDAAVVVTKDTGKNKFRTWKDETIAWLVGRRDGVWKLTGYFIRDIKNPE